jgi:hypothetical protein
MDENLDRQNNSEQKYIDSENFNEDLEEVIIVKYRVELLRQ